jgi:hypothetical protein
VTYAVAAEDVRGASPGPNAGQNGDFRTWTREKVGGVTTTSVGPPNGWPPDGWYGGPGVAGTATYNEIDFERDQTLAAPTNARGAQRVCYCSERAAGRVMWNRPWSFLDW